MMRTTLLLCVCIAALSIAAAELPANLRHDIDAGNQEWIDGLKTGDATKIAASYADDSVNCSAAGECVRGRDAVAAQYEQVIAKFGRATEASVRSESLRVDGDLAFESGSAESRFPGGTLRKGRFSTVWMRQPDGHWKIFRNMSLPAPRE